MTGGQVQVVFVSHVAPLRVRETAAGSEIAAKLVGGTSYSPTVGDAVLVVFVKSTYYVLGGA